VKGQRVRVERDPAVRALLLARGAVEAVARGEIQWLRDTAQDQLDNVRIVGTEDAYRSALATLQVHIDEAKSKAKRAAHKAGEIS